MRMSRTLVALCAVAALTIGAAACGDDDDAPADDGAQAAGAEVALSAQGGSGLSGTARLVEVDEGRTRVVIALESGDDGPPRPAHVHEGTCAQLNPAPAFPLENVTGGDSETVIEVALPDLLAGEYAINLHRSVDDLETYVACGDVG